MFEFSIFQIFETIYNKNRILMDTIKFLEDRCITKTKEGLKQIWLLVSYPQSKEYLSYKGKRYQLISSETTS